MIGPDVYNTHRKVHDSPLFPAIPSAKEIEKKIDEQEKLLKNIGAYADKLRWSEIKARIAFALPEWAINKYRKARNLNPYNNYENAQFGAVLNGCCLIYLRPYLDHETLLFEPDTFLYGEEILLNIKCETKGYKVLYDPDIQIEHKESVSTKADKKSYEDYARRKTEKLLHAFTIVKKCIEENPWEYDAKSSKLEVDAKE